MPNPPQARVEVGASLVASVSVNEGISSDKEATVAAASGLRLVGWSAREAADPAAVATVRFMNGETVSGGTGLLTIELDPDGSVGEWYSPEGIDAGNGLTIEVIAGTVDIYLYHKVL